MTLLAALVTALAGCGLQVPTDPDGTFERVSGGLLRVGTSPEPGLVTIVGGEPSGPEAELVNEFATHINADVRWTVAGEESLVAGLADGNLDLVVGGITDATPWLESAGATRGYPNIPGSDGRGLVMLVPLGENRFLTELETFLDERVE